MAPASGGRRWPSARNDGGAGACRFDRSMEYPREIFNQAWELGLVNTHIAEVR